MADHRNLATRPRMRSVQPLPPSSPAQHTDDVHLLADIPLLLDTLQAAALASDKNACDAVIETARRSGISAAEFADDLIPAVANRLGVLWENDAASFVDVSIASSRLQALLRQLGHAWHSAETARPNAPTILLVVPECDQHTLGVAVLAGKLRRSGYSVGIILQATSCQIIERINLSKVDAVFLSCFRSDPLEYVRRIVDSVRAAIPNAPPIVVGGRAIEAKPNIAALTGADFATSDPDEAIKLCGLVISQSMCLVRAARN